MAHIIICTLSQRLGLVITRFHATSTNSTSPCEYSSGKPAVLECTVSLLVVYCLCPGGVQVCAGSVGRRQHNSYASTALKLIAQSKIARAAYKLGCMPHTLGDTQELLSDV